MKITLVIRIAKGNEYDICSENGLMAGTVVKGIDSVWFVPDYTDRNDYDADQLIAIAQAMKKLAKK